MADTSENPVMPSAIAEAVNEVMQGVDKLAKVNQNLHGRYNFVSIDDFLEMTGQLCSNAGLIVLQDETGAELIAGTTADGKPKTSLKASYAFTLAHKSGVMWGPVYRHVLVDVMGAQTFGAAQSYTLKHFMRSLFQIPTGDADADEAKQSGFVMAGQAQQKKSMQAEAERIKKELGKAGSVEAIDEVIGGNGVALEDIKKASQSAYDFLMRLATNLKQQMMTDDDDENPFDAEHEN